MTRWMRGVIYGVSMGLVGAGAWMVYPPAALISVGLFLMLDLAIEGPVRTVNQGKRGRQ